MSALPSFVGLQAQDDQLKALRNWGTEAQQARKEMSAEDVKYWLHHGERIAPKRAGLSVREMPLTHCGVELVVQYEYEPAEKAEQDHPGFPANCDVLVVKTKSGDDITGLLDYQAIEALQDLVLEALDV